MDRKLSTPAYSFHLGPATVHYLLALEGPDFLGPKTALHEESRILNVNPERSYTSRFGIQKGEIFI